MSRETAEITTPKGNEKVIVHTYITGREFQYIQEPLMEAMSIKAAGAKDFDLGSLDMSKVNDSNNRMIEKYVVSVNDITESVLDLVLDMRQEDYEFVMEQIEVMSKKN